ncbi:MAG: UDP-N-acetylmuramoyl-L-alanyl-D-glutamate--2,6-diaminopimelate ligase [Rhizobiaceae bacterium]|nr:UDP-N-acetylmuramoyl-L-alanyl-D-glutamate--2,6-diaminopimelate ligase [Rhizobiaceae bacterium]
MNLKSLIGSHVDLDDALASIEVSNLASNTNDVSSGSLFFGLPGVNVDGAKFAYAAEKAGAVACVVSGSSAVPETEIPAIATDDPRVILAHASAAFYQTQPKTIGAVTGTAGKTSVATFLRQIWMAEGRSAASIGTTGVVAPGRDDYGNLTTPDPISLHRLLAELENDGVTHAAMEASSHGLDQHRLDGVELKVAGFTNLGHDHMDYHPTIEDYLAAKMVLFKERLPKGAPAIIFSDDAYSNAAIEAAREGGCGVCSVGRLGNFIALKKVEHQQHNQTIELEHDGKFYRVDFPLAGDFQVANGLVAAGMAIASGSDPAKVFSALESLEGASGRLELVGKTTQGSPAYVDYAHKPEALENVLASVRPFTSGRIVLVFGCGGDRDPSKRPIMGEIASRLADVVIVTDDNPRTEDPGSIRAEIMRACPGAMEVSDRGEAIHQACALMQEGDCLIVAGKGHEPGQIVGDTVLPFSDHDVLRAALEEGAE